MFSAATIAAGSFLFVLAGFAVYFYPVALYHWHRRRRRSRKAKRTAA